MPTAIRRAALRVNSLARDRRATPWLFSNSGGRAGFAGDGCCGGWDFRSLWSPWKHVSHELKPLHRKFDLLEKHGIIEETG
jgi:hypothetical protein